MKRSVLAALLVLPLLGSDSPKQYDDAAQEAGIEGDWSPIWTEWAGRISPEKPDQLYSYHAGQFRWTTGQTEGTYVVDRRYHPARLTEQTANKNSTFRNVFQIDGSILRVGYLESGSGYPTGFNDKRPMTIEVYRRVR